MSLSRSRRGGSLLLAAKWLHHTSDLGVLCRIVNLTGEVTSGIEQITREYRKRVAVIHEMPEMELPSRYSISPINCVNVTPSEALTMDKFSCIKCGAM